MTNSELENQIRTALNSDSAVRAANLSIEANAERNQAQLSGKVESEALRTKAVELAKSAHANLAVTDQISVVPAQDSREKYTEDRAKEERSKAKSFSDKLGDSLDDAWIHMKIVAKLVGNSTTEERKINVDVVQGAVTLRGNVDSADQKTEAERIAKNTDGVKSVTNQLKVVAKPKTRSS